MLAGSELVQIDEDDLLKELEALKSKPADLIKDITNMSVKDENIIEIDGEKIELPSVPKDNVKILEAKNETEQEEEYHEKELIAVAE